MIRDFLCVFVLEVQGGGGGSIVVREAAMKRKASREREEDEGGVGRPAAERERDYYSGLTAPSVRDSEAAHSDRIWPRPVRGLQSHWNLNPHPRCQPSSSPAPSPLRLIGINRCCC